MKDEEPKDQPLGTGEPKTELDQTTDSKSLFHKLKSSRKKYIILTVALVVVIGAFVFLKPKGYNGEQNNQKNADSTEASNQNCPSVFTSEFTDYDKINAFQPIGSITGASRGRSYITIKSDEQVPIYAPVDGTLTSIIYAFRGPDAKQGEYGFKIKATCGVTVLLDHIDIASDKMKKYSPSEPVTTTVQNDNLSVLIKAGTLLGYSDGTPQARTFDFLVLDENQKAKYINPKRWQWDQSLYGVCPYDYFESKLKDKYYQKIGETSQLAGQQVFTKSETCGSTSYDIADTISGGWFENDQATELSGEYMLIGSLFNRVEVNIKNSSENSLSRVSDYSPTKLPKDVGVGQEICYKSVSNWTYLKLADKNTIRMAKGQGSCPATMPTSNVKNYYR